MNTNSIDDYICSHSSPEPANLHRIDRESHLHLINGRMCSGHLQGRILKMLTQMINPRNALELGTFSGYSALCIAEGMQTGSILHTVEVDDELEDMILDNFRSSEHGEKIKLHIGDAIKVCGEFDNEYFDLIFMDADKRQYPEYYEEALRLIRKGGYIFADNTLWDGHVLEENPDRRDHQTIAIKRFNDMVAADERVEKVILPLRDGLTIIRKS